MGEYSKAFSYHDKDLEIRKKILPANHPDLATSYNNIGAVNYHMGDYSKALSYYERALNNL
jgi:tetratricopeptide (TPR) repeat protein